jgi:excisionase family DNA binding protein
MVRRKTHQEYATSFIHSYTTFEHNWLHKQEQPLSRTPRALLMTPEQCAEFLGIKINTLYVMKSQGRIPYRKVGHLLRFDFDEIVEWTKDNEK